MYTKSFNENKRSKTPKNIKKMQLFIAVWIYVNLKLEERIKKVPKENS